MKYLRDYWKKSGGLFLSVFTVAAVLPVVLVGALSNEPLRLSSKADEPTALRLWLEPESVSTKLGSRVEFEVLGEYEDQNLLIPKVELVANGQPIKYLRSFAGRVSLGKITAIADKVGEINIEIDDRSVFTGLPNLPVEVSAAKMFVK